MRRCGLLMIFVCMIVVLPWSIAEAKTKYLGTAYVLGVPIYNDSFRDYWQVGHGLSVESLIPIAKRMKVCFQFQYYHINLDNDALVEEFEPALNGTGQLRFDRGARKISTLHMNFTWSFIPKVETADFYLTAGGGYYYLHRRGVNGVFYREYEVTPNEVERIEFSEQIKPKQYVHAFGGNGGLGLEFKVGESTFLFVESKAHCILSDTKLTEDPIGKAERALNKDSGKSFIITHVIGLRWAY